MKIQKRNRKTGKYDDISSRQFNYLTIDGQLVLPFSDWDFRKTSYRVVFTADELNYLAKAVTKAISDNSPVNLCLTWKDKQYL